MKVKTVLCLVLALVLSGCSGPREPLEVGLREVANDIVLGAQGDGRPTPAMIAPPIPPAPVAVVIPRPRPVVRPTVAPDPTPGPTPFDPCPEAHPLSVPRWEALDNDGTPPVAEAFTFNNEGSFSVTGPNASEGSLDGPTPRRVEEVAVADNGNFTYDVVTDFLGTITTTSYLMRNEAVVDDDAGVLEQANADRQRGLFLTRVTTAQPDGNVVTFAPSDPLRLLRFPMVAGDTFDVVGTDPVTLTVMSFTVTVNGSSRVDACGEFIDTIQVDLTDGEVRYVGLTVDFAATYDIATQYGGLIVRDQVVESFTQGEDTYTRIQSATIASVPTHVTEAAAG